MMAHQVVRTQLLLCHEEPSAFMLERKAEDARVFYYFFKAVSMSQLKAAKLLVARISTFN
jgi:hypothetical protein